MANLSCHTGPIKFNQHWKMSMWLLYFLRIFQLLVVRNDEILFWMIWNHKIFLFSAGTPIMPLVDVFDDVCSLSHLFSGPQSDSSQRFRLLLFSCRYCQLLRHGYVWVWLQAEIEISTANPEMAGKISQADCPLDGLDPVWASALSSGYIQKWIDKRRSGSSRTPRNV